MAAVDLPLWMLGEGAQTWNVQKLAALRKACLVLLEALIHPYPLYGSTQEAASRFGLRRDIDAKWPQRPSHWSPGGIAVSGPRSCRLATSCVERAEQHRWTELSVHKGLVEGFLIFEAKGSMITYTSVATLLFTVNHGGILVARALVSATRSQAEFAPTNRRLLEEDWAKSGQAEEEALLRAATGVLDKEERGSGSTMLGAEAVKKAREASAAAKASAQWDLLLVAQHLLGRPAREPAPTWKDMTQELHRRRERLLSQAHSFQLIAALLDSV
ncbi:BTRC, partial [Symbiodinium sp. CCMP2456]